MHNRPESNRWWSSMNKIETILKLASTTNWKEKCTRISFVCKRYVYYRFVSVDPVCSQLAKGKAIRIVHRLIFFLFILLLLLLCCFFFFRKELALQHHSKAHIFLIQCFWPQISSDLKQKRERMYFILFIFFSFASSLKLQAQQKWFLLFVFSNELKYCGQIWGYQWF